MPNRDQNDNAHGDASLQNDRALELSLAARPHARRPHRPNDLAAFSRTNNGRSRKMRARWRGLARGG
eukprot:3349943-Lingulodinium_polyedra.AAC.1